MWESIYISFVIPVYNVENYIEQCVESVTIQGMCGYEIILVDDGSTDSSGQLCDQLVEKYCTVKVIHKENGGHSSARNLGLSIARGKYISFIDSDDFLDSHCLPVLLEWAEENSDDICFLKTYKYFSNGNIQQINKLPKRSEIKGVLPSKGLEAIMRGEKFPGSAWGKLFRRSFLTENSLTFPSDVVHGEDLRFVVQCFLTAASFDTLDIDYYYYRQGRKGSVTTSAKSERIFRDISDFVATTVELGEKNHEKKISMMKISVYEYLILVYTYHSLPLESRKMAKKFLKDYQWILSYSKSKRTWIVNLFLLLCGFRCTSMLIALWMYIRLKLW